MFLKKDDLHRVLGRKELTLNDVKAVFRSVRYSEQSTESITYANSLLSEAGDYLPSGMLRALVRADITTDEAALCLEQNRAFYSRLVGLLPDLIGFFNRRENLWGIVSCIDDCHNDFHVTAISPRRDRRIREAREALIRVLETTLAAAKALNEAKRYVEDEFDQYRKIHRPNLDRHRYLYELIDDLEMCSGVAEILNATVGLDPQMLFLSGNDARSIVVQYAYQMSTMWDGPKLVTTPGSQFSALCSFLFEAASGKSDEGLSGAINRFARSSERNQWDQEGEEEVEDDNDNFAAEKHVMKSSMREIERCKTLQRTSSLPSTASQLLFSKIDAEQRRYEEAKSALGPRQILMSQLNPEQLESVLKLPNRVQDLEALDLELGKLRRSARLKGIDV